MAWRSPVFAAAAHHAAGIVRAPVATVRPRIERRALRGRERADVHRDRALARDAREGLEVALDAHQASGAAADAAQLAVALGYVAARVGHGDDAGPDVVRCLATP